MNILRKLYDWVLGWSSSRWGEVALFVLALAEASFFPVPPDVLLIALCLGKPKRAFRYAAICTAGSVLGGVGGYAIGYFLLQNTAGEYTALANWFFDHNWFSQQGFDSAKALFDQYDFWVIFTAGFTPIPYKVFTIAGGIFHINFPMFIVASAISRGLRFFLVSGLIWRFGAPIKSFIDKYFNWLAIAFTVLLIGAFVLVKMVAG